METAAVPFGLHSYQSRSAPWSSQRIVNWYVQAAPPVGMTKSPVVLLPRYAKERWATLNGACRGNHRMGESLYSLFGARFYRIDPDGTATELGDIPGTAPATFADNGVQLAISAQGTGYLWVDGVLTTTGQSTSVAYVNGYFVHSVDEGSGEFVWSAVDDGATFDPLDFATAESDGDNLRRIIEHQQELWLFGQRSIEVWATTGNERSAFERLQSASIERGCIAKFSICKVSNSLFWIGDDRIVYRNAGYSPVRVSTDAVDKVLSDSTDLENVRAFYHVEDGHTFYTMMSVVDGWTFSFDVTTGLWAERDSYGLAYWNAFSGVNVYGRWIVGDDDGGVFKLVPNIYTDDGVTIRFKATSAPFFKSGVRVDMPRFRIDIEAGVGLTSGQGVDPQIMLRWSDDGGVNWSNEHWRTLGALGERKKRAVWRQQGQFESRIWEATITDPIKPVILGAYGDFNTLPP